MEFIAILAFWRALRYNTLQRDALLALAKSDRQRAMATSTVVVAREDLTIPGAFEAASLETADPNHIENEFFKTIEENKVDAVLLDLTASDGQGVAAIHRIRRRSAVPILVICRPEDEQTPAYREAGAAACLRPPIDLMEMKRALEGRGRGIEANGGAALAGSPKADDGVLFAGFVLRPGENRLIGPDGKGVDLSDIETRVLRHLAETPGVVWPATAIADAVAASPADEAEQTVGPVIARLRKKLAKLDGSAGQRLIKTEIGRGYMVAAAAVPAWPVAPVQS
ncbi:MAG: response regulator transcription factor [Alphaproteobacteria bacterium]|nr:response regulator transcription factor [Alphaproteobacteria bacterium]